MTIEQQILASGIVPPLRNPDAEKCAIDLATVILDPVARQKVYSDFLATHPDLKAWESQAIRNRAFCIAREYSKPKPQVETA